MRFKSHSFKKKKKKKRVGGLVPFCCLWPRGACTAALHKSALLAARHQGQSTFCSFFSHLFVSVRLHSTAPLSSHRHRTLRLLLVRPSSLPLVSLFIVTPSWPPLNQVTQQRPLDSWPQTDRFCKSKEPRAMGLSRSRSDSVTSLPFASYSWTLHIATNSVDEG